MHTPPPKSSAQHRPWEGFTATSLTTMSLQLHSFSLYQPDGSLWTLPNLREPEGPMRRRLLITFPKMPSHPLPGATHMASSWVSAHRCRREPSRKLTVSRPSRLRPSGGCTSKGRHTGFPWGAGPGPPSKPGIRTGTDFSGFYLLAIANFL